MGNLQELIDLIDDQVDLFDGTSPKNRAINDPLIGDAIGKAVKPLLFPYCLKRLFNHKGEC